MKKVTKLRLHIISLILDVALIIGAGYCAWWLGDYPRACFLLLLTLMSGKAFSND